MTIAISVHAHTSPVSS